MQGPGRRDASPAQARKRGAAATRVDRRAAQDVLGVPAMIATEQGVPVGTPADSKRDPMPSRFVCLLYHDVYAGDASQYGRIGRSATRYHVSECRFRQHLDLVERSGVRPLGAGALSACLDAPAGAAGLPGVVFSFDDGWEGAVTRAAAALVERRIPLLMFVTTDYIGRRFFARPEQLRELEPTLVTVGSHGVSHHLLSGVSSDTVRRELRDSRHRLEDVLGRSVTWLSAPGGAVDRRLVEVAREVGYTMVFTSAIGINPTAAGRWGVARLGVTAATSSATLSRWLSLRLYPERLRNGVLALPKRVLGMRLYAKLRRVVLGEAVGYDHLFEP